MTLLEKEVPPPDEDPAEVEPPRRRLAALTKNWADLRHTPYGTRPIGVLVFNQLAGGLVTAALAGAGPLILVDLNISLREIAGVQAIIGFFFIFAAMGIGWWADRHRRLPLVGIGTIIAGITTSIASRASSLLGLGLPQVAGGVAGQPEPLGQAGAAGESDVAHGRRVREDPPGGAYLPDAMVRFAPADPGLLHQGGQAAPHLGLEGSNRRLPSGRRSRGSRRRRRAGAGRPPRSPTAPAPNAGSPRDQTDPIRCSGLTTTNQPLEPSTILAAQNDHERTSPRHRNPNTCDAAAHAPGPSAGPPTYTQVLPQGTT
jgi:hypothetical protein